MNELLTRADVAKLLNVKEQTLAAWACSKRVVIPFVRVGSRVRYKPEDVAKFIEANRVAEGGAQSGSD